VAPLNPLARGWLRQLEADDIELFTDGNLDAASYASWLDEHGVEYVAVPDAELDYIAEDEVALIESGTLPYLREVWSDEHWRLYEVADSLEDDGTAVRDGARITLEQPGRFHVKTFGPGEYLLDMRWSPYYVVERGDACLEPAGDAQMLLTVAPGSEPGIDVATRLGLDGLLRREPSCSG
jgi:hypothetical protein